MAENDKLFNELHPIHTLVNADISCATEFFFEALCCATREAALKQQSVIYKYEVAWQKTKNGEIFTLNPNITGICCLLNSTGMCVLGATHFCVSCVLHKVGMPVLLVVLFSGCACAVEA